MTAPLTVFGTHEENTIQQMRDLMRYGSVERAAIMADGHFGYSQPVGGVVAYSEHVSVSGVGFDIACGNKAAKTDLTWGDIRHRLPEIADLIFKRIEFGVGRSNPVKVDSGLFYSDSWDVLSEVAGKHARDGLYSKARKQLGTVGSGNHYVDVFVEQVPLPDAPGLYGYEDESPVWIGVHFGSRGFGHTIASGFLNLAAGNAWDHRARKGEKVDSEIPALLTLDSDPGRAYLELMGLAGQYAYAGRDAVVSEVASILGGEIIHEVHNHHNFAWMEEHDGKQVFVVRKGATPLHPGQQSFIGGSMCDDSVIVEGIPTEEWALTSEPNDQETSMLSTVHGAGRVMGRMQAKGKKCKRCKGMGCPPNTEKGPQDATPCDGSGWLKQPRVTEQQWRDSVQDYGIQLRGAGVDESPFVYRKLRDVLGAHEATTRVLHRLRPVVVAMAGPEVRDPYKD